MTLNVSENKSAGAGDPKWVVRRTDGWPVALFWRLDMAEQYVREAKDLAFPTPAAPRDGVIDERCDNY